MKNILTLSILFSVIALPALSDLSDQDLEKIQQMIKESETALTSDIEEMNTKLDAIDTRLRTVETGVAWVRGKIEGVDKQFDSVNQQFRSVNQQFDSVNQRITHATNVSYALIALIVSAIAIPQIIMAWRSRKDRALEKQIETLAQEIETLKQQRIVNP